MVSSDMSEAVTLNNLGTRELVQIDDMILKASKEDSRELYSKLRNEREKTTFSMMMKMNPEALTAVRKEFFMREDKVKLPEFIYIIQKHLSGGIQTLDEDLFSMQTNEKREFGLNMCELFKEIDVNGDGDLEWQEFTQFVVEKANILNKRLKMTSIAHYSENTDSLDSSLVVRHRHDATSMIDIAPLGLVALVEDHKNQIFILNASRGQYIQNNPGDIKTDAAPIAMSYIEENHTLVASLSNMTMCTYSLDNPNPNKKYKTLSTWASPGVQMAVTYMPKNRLLYSGATTGDIFSWKIKERKIYDTLTGHTDMVMSLVTLPKLNYLASASLDKTVSIWDAYTNQQLLKLYGHKKGVLDVDYSSNYRLLVSAGFEHDAYVWSPFVHTLVYRLKGHHHSLVGCQAIKDTPEIITADTSGVLKLWDIRNFQCVQSFDANLSGQEVKDGSKLGCFLHCSLPNKTLNHENDSRIYAASKVLFAFDQMRVVHDATTDYSNVLWMLYDEEHMTIITVSERNVMIWDALLGSKTTTVNNICGHEISACCLDDRKRKIVIGDVSGAIAVYNAASGGMMKTTCHDNFFIVVALQYMDDVRRFIAAYKNGVMRLYDESGLEDCHLLMTFETAHSHPEMLNMVYNYWDCTAATVGASCDTALLWDCNSGKLEKEIDVCDEAEHIVQIACLVPFPIIVTSDSSGNIIFFGTRGCKWSGKRISGFLNQTPLTAEYEEVVIRPKDEEEPPLRAMIFGHDTVVPTFPSVRMESAGRSRFGALSEEQSLGSDDDEAGEDVEEWQSALNFLDRKATEETVKECLIESETKWGKVTPAQAFGWEEHSMQLYTVDALGNLRSFCLKDFMSDMRRTFDSKLQHKKKNTVGDLCKRRLHHPLSAMPPLPQKGKSYLLGHGNDATSYLGVRFNWSVEAHAACIVCCKVIPDGVLTSAADKLVKMWTFSGQPLGVLIQSVPESTRSRLWSLEIDVEPAMVRESSELDDVIRRVHELVEDQNKPELDGYDFYGIEPGEHSTAFSRSELRQRIEKTSSILGVDFAVHNIPRTAYDNDEEDSLELFNPALFDGANSNGAGLTGAGAVKTFERALTELKSSDASTSMRCRNSGLSKLQIRRKSTKMEEISCLYETKTGIKISLSDNGNQARSTLSKTLSGEGVEYRASSSLRTKSGHQRAIKSHKIFSIDNARNGGSLSSINITSSVPSKDGYKLKPWSAESAPSELGDTSADEAKKGKKVQISPLDFVMNPSKESLSGFFATGSVSEGQSPTKRGATGSRSGVINEVCSKFSTFQAMENLLTENRSNSSPRRILPLKPDDLEKLKRAKEAKRLIIEKNQS